MTPSPTPSPSGEPWLEIHGPLFVFPDGSWSILISALALVVSGLGLWFTLSSRSKVDAFVMRGYLELNGKPHVDGDEVVVTNVGRSPAIIYDVRALTKNGRHLKAATMPRGHDRTPTSFPVMPQTLGPGAVLTAWFSSALAGDAAGVDYGYMITYAPTGGWRAKTGARKEMTVKAVNEPPP